MSLEELGKHAAQPTPEQQKILDAHPEWSDHMREIFLALCEPRTRIRIHGDHTVQILEDGRFK